jgi:hypothetical protein
MKQFHLAVCCFLIVVPAGLSQAGQIYVDAFKFSDPAYQTAVQVDLAELGGITAVGALTANGTALTLDAFGSGQYGAWTGLWSNFSDFHSATVGNWRLTVTLGGAGQAVYDFVVNDFRSPFTADSFPPAPTVTYPPDGGGGIPQTPTFQWNNGGPHTGPLESLFVRTDSTVNPAVFEFASSSAGPLTLNSVSWTPSVVLPAGAATFLVQYETNQDEDANVDDPVFNPSLSTAADPNVNWVGSSGDLFSRDLVGFTVLPEPATLGLLVLGGLALCLRRREPGGNAD